MPQSLAKIISSSNRYDYGHGKTDMPSKWNAPRCISPLRANIVFHEHDRSFHEKDVPYAFAE